MKPNTITRTIIYSLGLLLLVNCSKEKQSDNKVAITQSKWQLKSIVSGNNISEPASEHILKFENDTLFYLSLSVNRAAGKYLIEEKGKITIESYTALTEICCDSDFDNELLAAFKKVTHYDVQGNKLTFKADDLKIKFSNCESNGKEDLSSKNNHDLFVGKWELMRLTGGFAPPETFHENKITWEFNPNDSLNLFDDLASDGFVLEFEAK